MGKRGLSLVMCVGFHDIRDELNIYHYISRTSTFMRMHTFDFKSCYIKKDCFKTNNTHLGEADPTAQATNPPPSLGAYPDT